MPRFSFFKHLRSGWFVSMLALFVGVLPPGKADTPFTSNDVASPLSFTLTKSAAPDAMQGWEIPFAYDPPGRPLLTVQVRVNQSPPMTFLVDTGADNIVVFPWAARLLDLKPTDVTIPSSSGKSVASLLPPCDLTLVASPGSHDLTLHTESLLMANIQSLEGYPGPHVAGILGGFIFQKRVSRFDFERKILTFLPEKASLPKPTGPFTTLPLLKEAGRDRLAVVLSLPGMPPTPFILDTGTDMSSAPDKVATNLASLATGRTWFQNMDGSQSVSTLLLAELPLGDLSTELVELGLRSDRSHGLLGLNVLARFRVTLDPFRSQLILEPRPGYQSRLSGHTGTLEARGGAFTIAGIEDTAARKGGVRIGDRILAINGESTQNMNAMEVELKLNGYEGTDLALELEKPDRQRRSVRFQPRSHFPSLVRSNLGLLLIHDTGQPARVIKIQPDSEAAHAGIQSGDAVISVNGKPTIGMTAAALLHELGEDTAGKSPLKALTIQPSGKVKSRVLLYEEGKLKTALP